MSLFTPDLYRQLAIGFALGTALVALANADTFANEIDGPAQAAEVPQAPQPSPEFLID